MSAALILGEEPRIIVGVARSLARRGIHVDVATSTSGTVPSRAIRHWLRLPSIHADPDFFLTNLLRHVEGAGYARLIPVSDTALATVAQHYSSLSQIVSLACPAPPVVRRVLDKMETLAIARRADIPAPATISAAGRERFSLDGLRFPLIAKPKGKGAEGRVPFKVRRFECAEEVARALAQWPALATECLFQDYCPGVGVGVEVLMDAGRPLVCFQHRRLSEYPRAGGVSVVAVSEPLDPLLADRAVRLLQALEWDGPAMVEFRVDPASNQAMLMEVNGRYWGSLALSIHAGVDFPWLDWQRAHRLPVSVPDRYAVGMRMRWSTGLVTLLHDDLHGHRLTDGTLTRAVRSFLTDWTAGTRDMLWSWEDPRPALSELGRACRRFAWAAVRRGLSQVIPQPLLAIRARSRLLSGRARRLYVRHALLRAAGLLSHRLPARLVIHRTVLFVCHGNIIRSPMAAALLREAVARRGGELSVESAGVHAVPLKPADPRAVIAATRFGVSLDHHRAMPITPDLVAQADAIFVMDAFNEADIVARYPSARGRVFFLSACQQGACALDIDDPYRGDLADVLRCYETIRTCIEDLVERLALPRPHPSGTAPCYVAPSPSCIHQTGTP